MAGLSGDLVRVSLHDHAGSMRHRWQVVEVADGSLEWVDVETGELSRDPRDARCWCEVCGQAWRVNGDQWVPEQYLGPWPTALARLRRVSMPGLDEGSPLTERGAAVLAEWRAPGGLLDRSRHRIAS